MSTAEKHCKGDDERKMTCRKRHNLDKANHQNRTSRHKLLVAEPEDGNDPVRGYQNRL